MTTPMIEIVAREPFDTGAQALSGARFERGLLDDGRAVILKHLPPEGDWLTRVSRSDDRVRRLWDAGTFDRIAATVDHAVIDVRREDDHDVVVMHDVSDTLLQPAGGCSVVTPDQTARLIAGLAALHLAWEGCAIDGLCTVADRHRILTPQFHGPDSGPNLHPNRAGILKGWETFPDLMPADLTAAVTAVQNDTARLEDQMRDSSAWTLLHGDAKPDNLGLRGEQLVAIDWGDLTGTGPAAIELMWFIMHGTRPLPGAPNGRVEAMPDELIAVYEAHLPHPLDTAALDLACIGMLAQMGWSLTFPLAADPDGPQRRRAVELIDWWVNRVRRALDSWSPV